MINCNNDDCGLAFQFNLTDLNIDSCDSTDGLTTQYLASGPVYCYHCNHEMDVSCEWDQVNDTGEILSKVIRS